MTDGEYKYPWKLASLACPRVRLSTPLAVGDLCGPTALWLSLIQPLYAAAPVRDGSVPGLCMTYARCRPPVHVMSSLTDSTDPVSPLPSPPPSPRLFTSLLPASLPSLTSFTVR